MLLQFEKDALLSCQLKDEGPAEGQGYKMLNPGNWRSLGFTDHSNAIFMVEKFEGEASEICSARIRRLQACWNACAGIDTETLEAYAKALHEKAG